VLSLCAAVLGLLWAPSPAQARPGGAPEPALATAPLARGGAPVTDTASVESPGLVSFVAGGGTASNLTAPLLPAAATVHDGVLYFTDLFASVWQLDRATGIARHIVGTGTAGFSGDGGPSVDAQVAAPRGIVADGAGNLFIADSTNNRIRRIDAATGIITTYAGTGQDQLDTGDGGPAATAAIWAPRALAIGPDGDLFVSTPVSIRRIDVATGTISRVAGTGGSGETGPPPDGVPAVDTPLSGISSIAVAPDGDVFEVEQGRPMVRRIDHSSGLIWTVGATTAPGDPAPDALLDQPVALAVDPAGAVLVGAAGHVRRIDLTTHALTTLAGDDLAGIVDVASFAFDESGRLLISSSSAGFLATLALPSQEVSYLPFSPVGMSGDGGPATAALFDLASDAARAPNGDLYLSDEGANRIRRIDHATNVITTVAGTGSASAFGGWCAPKPAPDGRLATMSQLCHPRELAFDAAGTLYVVEAGYGTIRKIDPVTATMSTVPTAVPGSVSNIAVTGAGDLYYATGFGFGAHTVRRIDHQTQADTLIAGKPGGSVIDGGRAVDAALLVVTGIAVTPEGDVFIGDNGTERVSRVSAATGLINAVFGGSGSTSAHDGGPGTQAALAPGHLRLAPNGDLYVVDHRPSKDVIRVLRHDGIATTLTGTGAPGLPAPGATAAELGLRGITAVVPSSSGSVDLVTRRLGFNPPAPEENRVFRIAPPIAPGAPTAVSALGDTGRATVSWTPPAVQGGVPLAGYLVTAQPGGQTCIAFDGATHCEVTGLTDGQLSTFSVRARNVVADGPASTPSDAVAPVAGNAYFPIAHRALDSRTSAAAWIGWDGTPLDQSAPRSMLLAYDGGVVPASARAVVLNVTVTEGSAPSYLRVYPAGGAPPTASSLNFGAYETRPNLVTVAVGPGGLVSFANAAGHVHVIVDIEGYYAEGGTNGLRFTPSTPVRALDSRTATGGWSGALVAGAPRDLDVTSVAPSAQAVAINVTVTASTKGSFLTAWPSAEPPPPPPTVSNLNFGPGETVANLAIVRVGPNGKIRFATAVGSVHVIVDVVGSYGSGPGALFHPMAPRRLLDDRIGLGLLGPFGPGAIRTLPLVPGVATTDRTTAVALNVTATNGTLGSFLTVSSTTAATGTSTLNFARGQTVANAAHVGTPNPGIPIVNALGQVDVVIDAAGYFAPD
jgi:hypothetical protein